MATQSEHETIVRVTGLKTQFGQQVIHENLDLDVRRGEVIGVVGGSGTGKSVLLREIVGLQPVTEGHIEVLGTDVTSCGAEAQQILRQHWGVMFQEGALFSSLTVAQNIQVPIRELTDFPQWAQDEIARVKLAMVGLPPDAGAKFPSQLSGGMKKRAGLARALALDPELLFLDEPTGGLDPASADGVGALIRDLRDLLGLTVVIITHDLDLLWQVADRVAVIGGGKVRGVGSMAELSAMPHPDIRPFFDTPRGRAAQQDAARRGDVPAMQELR